MAWVNLCSCLPLLNEIENVGAFLLSLLSFAGGAACVYFAIDAKRRRLAALDEQLQTHQVTVEETEERLRTRQHRLEQDTSAFGAEAQGFHVAKMTFESRVIQYDELGKENKILKSDLHRIGMSVAKQAFESEQLGKTQASQQAKADDLGRAYLSDTRKWLDAKLDPDNYSKSKQRLTEAIERIRATGANLNASDERSAFSELQFEYERVVRAALEREEQAGIRAKFREDQQREREVQRLLEESERERRAARILEEALAKALAAADGKHNAAVAQLQTQLADANARIEESQRTISQAQLTKAGNVYVISNIGAFGSDVFKIGMTRRLEPLDRVRELGDASVPFPFDVHMMIVCNDAPKLENTLHRAFHKKRLNKTNPRKEFFRVTIGEIADVVKKNHGEVQYTADPEALQYRQSQNMKDEDLEFIEQTYQQFEDKHPQGADEE